MSPLVGMHPVTRSRRLLWDFSSSQRASVTSGGTTNGKLGDRAGDREGAAQEEETGERAGTTSQLGGDGGYYGPQGPESQWT